MPICLQKGQQCAQNSWQVNGFESLVSIYDVDLTTEAIISTEKNRENFLVGDLGE